MNGYGNVLLEEYYNFQGTTKALTLFHVDYVETFPKSNGSYSSYHTDIDSSSGSGGGNSGGDCDDCGPVGTLLGLGAGICCCLNTETVCTCFTDCLISILEGLCDGSC